MSTIRPVKLALGTILGILLINPPAIVACTNIIISKGATKDGSTMITYAADSHTLYGELYYRPSADYPEGTMVKVVDWDSGVLLGEIPQVRHTYSVVGNMNEYQVSIGETTYGGRPELVDTNAIIDYGSLMYLALQRARSAREAIHVMASLVGKYGYRSEGESFSVADPNEVWIFEMIGKGSASRGAVWVARRVPDGYICGHANQSRITTFPLDDTLNCLYASDVIAVARQRGYFNGSDRDFSFCDAYAPINFEGARFCEARIWSVFNRVKSGMDEYEDYASGRNLKHRMPLWIKPDRKLAVHDVMELMRDYFQGTPFDLSKEPGAGPFGCPYRWRPLTWSVDSVEYINERSIATQQTGFSFVAQARSWLPSPIGGIFWFGVDDIYQTVYTPMYCGITAVPHAFAEGNGSMMEFSDDAAFWIFNQVSNFTYTRFNVIVVDVRARQAELESKYLELTPAVDQAALALSKTSMDAARQYLTDFSIAQGQNTFTVWKRLYQDLFVKYVDGNIKTKVPNQFLPTLKQPGYSEGWYREVAKQSGDKLKVVGGTSH
jgi:dipeptidase